jgi:hypothetical protein
VEEDLPPHCPAAKRIHAQVHGHAPKPGGGARIVLKIREPAVKAEERFLGGILRFGGIPQEPRAETKYRRPPALKK